MDEEKQEAPWTGVKKYFKWRFKIAIIALIIIAILWLISLAF